MGSWRWLYSACFSPLQATVTFDSNPSLTKIDRARHAIARSSARSCIHLSTIILLYHHDQPMQTHPLSKISPSDGQVLIIISFILSPLSSQSKISIISWSAGLRFFITVSSSSIHCLTTKNHDVIVSEKSIYLHSRATQRRGKRD